MVTGIVAVGGRGYIKTLIAFDEISHIGRAHINGICNFTLATSVIVSSAGISNVLT